MTISHHPGEELLLDYATGSLAETWSLAVAAHLALCPSCRRTVNEFELVGGHLVGDVAPEPVEDSLFEGIVAATISEDNDIAPAHPC